MGAPPHEPLDRSACLDVLRYWLASVRLEEALGARPRARRGQPARAVPRVDTPTPGQEYFKLRFGSALVDLLQDGRAFKHPFDAEVAAFFETWLSGQYRRAEIEPAGTHWLSFPVVPLRRGELAGLLRYRLEVAYGYEDGGTFQCPSWKQRRAQRWPAPPDEVRIAPAERKAGQWPFFIDTRLWSHQLGVREATLDRLFTDLRAREDLDEADMLARMAETLEAELSDEPAATGPSAVAVPVATSLERILAAASALVARHGPSSATIYPVGIVLDGERAKTTGHLQRELQALVGERDGPPLLMNSALGFYLRGSTPSPQRMPQRASFRGSQLTESQRAAAEQTWGSEFTAIQGPPGTGKTTVILHLCAEALLRQVEPLLEGAPMGDRLMLVTSTNNRAVDNVIDPLVALDPDLPLALRGGSRLVCEQQLAPQLRRTLAWLQAQTQVPTSDRAHAFVLAKDALRDALAVVHGAQAPRAAWFEARRRKVHLEDALEQVTAPDDDVLATALQLGFTDALANDLAAHLPPLRRRLETLAELCDAVPGTIALRTAARHYRVTQRQHVAPVMAALSQAALDFEVGLPPVLPEHPDPDEALEAWQDATDVALARIDELATLSFAVRKLATHRLRRAELELELQRLAQEPCDVPPLPLGAHAMGEAAFEAALQLRRAWAASHAETLVPHLALAARATVDDRTLRGLPRRSPSAWADLRRLFGIWGSTLLSIGNLWELDAEILERVIIDEAGQCHPAYAVSALARARNAIVLGDVHQLEPVVDLTLDDDRRALQTARIGLAEEVLAPYRIHATRPTSVQALADRAVAHPLRLRDHFRCQREIIEICDALCNYGLEVHTVPASRAAHMPALDHPVLWLDIPGRQERLGGSWHNTAQCETTIDLVHALLAHGFEPEEIAVITPYRGQLERLRRACVGYGIRLASTSELVADEYAGFAGGLALGTVHRFQGGERSVVLFTSVVTEIGSLGFLDERENLLNVALSRARHHFIGLGDGETMSRGRRTSRIIRAARPFPWTPPR